MKLFCGFPMISLTSVLLGTGFAAAQERPTVGVPTVAASGAINLLVHGQPGTNYALEASTDLSVWWKLSSGFALNGQIGFSYQPTTNASSHYFRARVDVPLPRLNVTVHANTNNADLALLTPDSTAVLSLTDHNGSSYTLTIPTNAVTDAEILSMTLVTNVTGVPFAAQPIGTVLLTPAGLNLQSPAQLEITFRTNTPVDPGSLGAFAFDDDGSFLRLTLSVPETNGIAIPVYTLNGVGCGIATLPELEQLSQRPVGPVGLSGNGSVALQSYPPARPIGKELYPIEQCEPTQRNRALVVETILKEKLAELSASLAIRAHEELANNPTLRGLNWNVPWLGNEGAFWQDVYDSDFEPYLIEAETNCALTEMMAREILALDAFERTFGHPKVLPSDEAQFHLQRGYQHCLETIDACCLNQGLGGQIAVNSAQTYAAKACPNGGSSLEGHGDCSDIYLMLARIENHCLPTWSGQITVRTVTTYKEHITDGPVTSDENSIEDCYVQYSTDANGLVGSSAGTGYYGIKGSLKASGRCGYVYNATFKDTSPECGPTITTVKDTAAALVSSTATCGFIWQLTNSPPPPSPILLPNTVIPGDSLIRQTHQAPGDFHSETKSFTSSTPPDGGTPVCSATTDTESGPIHYDFSGVIYLNFQPTVQGTADQFKGSWSTNMPHSDGLRTTSIMADWSFSRN